MKISHEVKIGFAVFVILAMFIWGYNFMKGHDILSSSVHYYIFFDEINGLEESSPVTLNGYKIGTVSRIGFVPEKTGELEVRLSIEEQVNLPLNTIAEIYNSDLLGTKAIRLVTGDGESFVNNGDTLKGQIEIALQDQIGEQLYPLKEKAENLMVSIDSVLSILHYTFNSNFSNDLGKSVRHIKNTLGALDTMVAKKDGSFAETMANIESITRNLAKNNDELTRTLENLASVSDSIAQLNIRSSINNLDQSLANLNSILIKINDGTGTAGMIINNDSLYYQFVETIESLNLLLRDIQMNPKRYVHFSLF
ncbi:MAG: MCE family protein [Bacteroidales bacterium]|nr:MCE family protein [Bacteroidales bacterium]